VKCIQSTEINIQTGTKANVTGNTQQNQKNQGTKETDNNPRNESIKKLALLQSF